MKLEILANGETVLNVLQDLRGIGTIGLIGLATLVLAYVLVNFPRSPK